MFHPAFFNANFEAGIGPVPINFGLTPHCAHDVILAIGINFFLFAVFPFIMVTAAAPSFNPEEFPAVTVPFSLKTVLRFANFSKFVSSLGCSSLSKIF